MAKEVINLIAQIARVRNVDVNYVCETLKTSLISGLRRRFGKEALPEVEVDPEQGEVRVFLLKNVVLNPQNPVIEISKDEAAHLKKGVRLGEVLRVEIPLDEVGRIAIRRAGEELMVKLREAEGSRLYEEFIKKKGDIVTGTIRQIGRDGISVSLGLVDAYLPTKEQLKTDNYRQGLPIKSYIQKVERTPLGPKIFLSRTHPEFLKKLLWREVPELQEGVIEIKGIVRVPGFRAKVAIHSNDDKIDPVGACVGYKKSRIQNILKELSGEKVDIILWAKETTAFIARALGPAKVAEVLKENDSYTVVVPDKEFSIAIGKKGQNVWLASLLTQTKLDVLKESDYANRLLMKKAGSMPIAKIKELPDEFKTKLVEAGLKTSFEFLNSPNENLEQITGFQIPAIEELKKKVREHIG
jgi:N utilization substance protein A